MRRVGRGTTSFNSHARTNQFSRLGAKGGENGCTPLVRHGPLRRTAVRHMSATTDPLNVSELIDAHCPRTAPMQLMAAGVPLTLLIDLLASDGPDSAAINAVERPPPGSMWIRDCG